MRTLYNLYRIYRRTGMTRLHAIKSAHRVWQKGF